MFVSFVLWWAIWHAASRGLDPWADTGDPLCDDDDDNNQDPRPTPNNPRPTDNTTRDPRLTTHNPQPTTRGPRPTAKATAQDRNRAPAHGPASATATHKLNHSCHKILHDSSYAQQPRAIQADGKTSATLGILAVPAAEYDAPEEQLLFIQSMGPDRGVPEEQVFLIESEGPDKAVLEEQLLFIESKGARGQTECTRRATAF